MKQFFTLCFCVATFALVNAQGGTWIWIMGDTTRGPVPGVFGTQGVADSNNIPPHLYQSANWVDQQGNFWLFGGHDSLPLEVWSDLWKFNPSTKMWTWVKGPGVPNQPGVYGIKGVPSINNNPGARSYGPAYWTDNDNNLWLYGGGGIDTNVAPLGNLGDLWRYNIATNEWTWIGGISRTYEGGTIGLPVLGPLQQFTDSSTPGNTEEQCSVWTGTNNDEWFFDGTHETMWRYDMGINEWARMRGPDTYTPVYGAKNVERPTNTPGRRWAYSRWQDANGNFFVWAGGISGGFPIPVYGDEDDMWKYNSNTNNWTWIGGDSNAVLSGHYTVLCKDTSANNPHARFENKTAIVANAQCGAVNYGFGGVTAVGVGFPGYYDVYTLNDLWVFNMSTYTWKWITGTKDTTPFNYGIKGVASPSNYPRVRMGTSIWEDGNNNLWIYGGIYADQTGTGVLGDMWEFIPDTSCIKLVATDSLVYSVNKTSICRGDSVLLTISTAGTGIVPLAGVIWIDSTHAVLKPDSTTQYMLTAVTPCGRYDTAFQQIHVTNASVNISSNKAAVCPGDSAQICAPAGYSGYRWNNGATTPCINTLYAGNYYVTVLNDSGCVATSNTIPITVYPGSPVAITQSGDTLQAYNSATYQWYLNGQALAGDTSPVLIATTTGTYTVQVTDTNGCTATSKPLLVSSINNATLANSINVYPNPTNSTWQLDVTPQLIGSTAEVFDVTGKLVFKSTITNQQSTINIPDASKGIYLLQITSVNFVGTWKLEKM